MEKPRLVEGVPAGGGWNGVVIEVPAKPNHSRIKNLSAAHWCTCVWGSVTVTGLAWGAEKSVNIRIFAPDPSYKLQVLWLPKGSSFTRGVRTSRHTPAQAETWKESCEVTLSRRHQR